MFEKNIDSRISIAIQECIACAHRGPNFTTGKDQRNESLFNKDVFIQRRRVTNQRYYTHLFSLQCLNKGFTTARSVNMENRSTSEIINKVAKNHWIYGEYGDGFGKPQNAFFTPRGGGATFAVYKKQVKQRQKLAGQTW